MLLWFLFSCMTLMGDVRSSDCVMLREDLPTWFDCHVEAMREIQVPHFAICLPRWVSTK